MSVYELSLIDRAEHGDTKAIIELLKKHIFSQEFSVYWVWQALVCSASMNDIPEKDLFKAFFTFTIAKLDNFLNVSEAEVLQTLEEQYMDLQPGRACIVSYYGTSVEKQERQYLEAGCKAKSRFCAELLAEQLSHENEGKLKAGKLCFEALGWPFDKVTDDDNHTDETLKRKGSKYILDYLHCNEIPPEQAKPYLITVYKNGDHKQKRESAMMLEDGALVLIKDCFSMAASVAQQGRYREAADICKQLYSKKREIVKRLPKHDRVDKRFEDLESKREKYFKAIRKPSVYVFLAVLLGYFGAHDFYAGSPKKGKCKLCISVLSLGCLAPVSWMLALFQLLNLKGNLEGNVKNDKHLKVSIIGCFILYFILLGFISPIRERTSKLQEKASAIQENTTETSSVLREKASSIQENTTETRELTSETIPEVSPPMLPLKDRLLEAVKIGDAKEVNRLMKEGADLSIKDADNRDLLTLAVISGDAATIGVLLEKQGKWDSAQKLLLESVHGNKAVVVESLVTHGVSANAYKNENNKTLLHLAVDAESLETVQALLKGKANPNARNNERRTPIYSAIYRKNTAIIKALLGAGARTKVEDKWQITPLEFAKEQRCPSSIISLLKKDSRSSLDPLLARMRALKCKHADSALYQKHLLVLLPMIRNGEDVNITLPETKGNTALHYSCAIGSLSITRWLLEHGANPNAVTDAGATPMMCVGSDNSTAIRKLLRQYGATH